MNSAILAYEEGDLRYALEEMAFVQQLVNEKRQHILDSFLPDSPDGWTRQDNTYGARGQGLNASAVYSNGSEQFNITIMLDSPVAAQTTTMISNPATLGGQAKLVRIGRTKFLQQGSQISGVISGNILVQGTGNDIEKVTAALKSIDLSGLGGAGI